MPDETPLTADQRRAIADAYVDELRDYFLAASAPPQPAPEVIMDANGNYWRRYEDGTLSMCPVSTDNLPLAEPVVVYSKEGDPR